MDIYQMLYPRVQKYMFFPYTYRTSTKKNLIMDGETSLNKFQRMKLEYFSNFNASEKSV